MNNYEQLKLEANGYLPAVVQEAKKYDALEDGVARRYRVREAIRAQLDSHKLQGAARRFCADYLMAQFGYGGGF